MLAEHIQYQGPGYPKPTAPELLRHIVKCTSASSAGLSAQLKDTVTRAYERQVHRTHDPCEH